MKKTRRIAIMLIMVFSWHVPYGVHAQNAPSFSGYEYYVTPDHSVGLYKPNGWKVGNQRYPNGWMVYVTDPQDVSLVSMTLLHDIDPRYSAVKFTGDTLKRVQEQQPDMRIINARCTQDRMRSVVNVQRTGPNNIRMQGRYHFNVTPPKATVFGCEAPARRFQAILPQLLTILSNITILDEKAYQRLAAQRRPNSPFYLKMNQVAAQDQSCTLLVPAGWQLTAGQGAALCYSSNGDIGYIFTILDFVGQSGIPYFSSSNISGNLRYNYMAPTHALLIGMKHFGSSNMKVLERYNNAAWATQATAFLRRQTDAEISVVSYHSKNGTPCISYFDVLGLRPTYAGQWSIIIMGIWAPQNQYARYLPSLIKIWESYRINQQWASEYVRQGIANLKNLMQQTSSMMSRYAREMRQSSLAGHQNRMRSSDFISYKFSTYMRGEQEWITGLAGGRIYTTDHHGLSSGGRTLIEGPPFNYYNYQGDVRHGHIPVDISREVFEMVQGIR